MLVILGVLVAPSVATCFNSPDGMGLCLRGKMVDAGLFPPQQASDAVATKPETASDAAAEIAAAAPGNDIAASPNNDISAAPELDVTSPASDAAAPSSEGDAVIAATFGLLRAEPDGSIVIAGSGTPGSTVEVYANDEPLGTAKVETSGDWVLVPDRPLPAGGQEITLGETGKTGRAAEAYVVVVNDDKATQPLVVASTPGQASEVLQGLGNQTTQVAATEAPAATVSAPASASAPAAASSASTTSSTASAPAEAPTNTMAPSSTATEPAPASTASSPAASATETEFAASTATAETAPTTQSAPAATSTAPTQTAATSTTTPASTAAPAAATTEAPATAAAAPANAMAAAPTNTTASPATTTPPAAQAEVAAVPPTIDAIEIEGDRTFFAGAGPDGGTIRLYVDDSFVADAVIDGGRWLVEAGKVLSKPTQRVRADLLKAGSADVASRAEVNFEVDLPTSEPSTAVADTAQSSATPAAPAQNRSPAAATTPKPATAAAANNEPAATTEPAKPTTTDSTPAAPASQPSVDAASQPTSTASASEPANTTQPTVTAEATAPATKPQPSTAAPVAPNTEPAVPTMVAVSLGDAEAQRFASGKAIIRRGDNLWTIARRVYGEGVKYTTIYQANTGQIRDPDRIYPGQVFELPKGGQ